MSLTVTTLRGEREQEEGRMAVVLKQRTYRTAEGKACRRGEPGAAFLVGPEGAKISDEQARSLGLIDGRIPEPGEKAAHGRGDRTGRSSVGQGRPVTQPGEPKQPTGEPDPGDGLASMPAAQLKVVAKEAGVPGYGSMNKDTLIESIRAKRATAGASTSTEGTDGSDREGQEPEGDGEGQGADGAGEPDAGEGDDDPEQGPGAGTGSRFL